LFRSTEDNRKTLEESAREYQLTHGKKTELQEVEVFTGEENESNVIQVTLSHLHSPAGKIA